MPIWQDRNISPMDFKDLKAGFLRVSSIFHTIQGEGMFAGMPATFVRLAGCNYGSKESFLCHFCDANFKFDESKVMHVDEIESEIRNVSGIQEPRGRLVVITGGEPFIQDNLIDLIEFLSDKGYKVQIESNGSRITKEFYSRSMVDNFKYKYFLVVSPKVVRGKYSIPSPKILDLTDSLKFLVSGDPESLYYNIPPYFEELVERYSDINIFFSPIAYYKKEPIHEGRSASLISENNKNYWDVERTMASHVRAFQLVIESSKKFPDADIRLSLQQQIFLGVE